MHDILKRSLQRTLVFLSCILCMNALAVEPSPNAPPPSIGQPVDFLAEYNQGKLLYKAQKFEDAIKFFQRALTLQHDPNVIYNIAQSHRKLGHHREAKEYFEWFLRIPSTISIAERQSVEEIVTELGEKIRREEAAKLVIVSQESSRRPPWRIGVGITAIAAGATLVSFGGMLASINGQPGLINGKEDFTQIYNTQGVVAGLIAPGALFVVGGIVLLALPGEKRSTNSPLPTSTQKLSLRPIGSGVGLVAHGSF